jgi:LEA14-like dessication related protein
MAGVEPLPGQGLELRMLVKLRIQNPNDRPMDFSGVFVRMDVQGKRFATGVSDAAASVPRFGETVIGVPVSISTVQIARQVLGLMTGEHPGKVAYELTGNLGGAPSSCTRFKSRGEFALPEPFLEGSD